MRRDKKKKGLVIVLLLIAVLILGVGYAAITNVTLHITGQATATSDDSNFDVNFVGTPLFSKVGVTKGDASDVTVTPAITDVHDATIQVTGLTGVGDYVTATYDIKNVSPEAITAALTASVSNDNTEYFDVQYVFDQSSIAQNAQTTITVTVTLIKAVVSTDQTANIDVTLVATPQ